jgi:hypothetical protein
VASSYCRHYSLLSSFRGGARRRARNPFLHGDGVSKDRPCDNPESSSRPWIASRSLLSGGACADPVGSQ